MPHDLESRASPISSVALSMLLLKAGHQRALNILYILVQMPGIMPAFRVKLTPNLLRLDQMPVKTQVKTSNNKPQPLGTGQEVDRWTASFSRFTAFTFTPPGEDKRVRKGRRPQPAPGFIKNDLLGKLLRKFKDLLLFPFGDIAVWVLVAFGPS